MQAKELLNIPVTKQYMPKYQSAEGNLLSYFVRGFYSNNGLFIQKYENLLKDYFGVKYAIYTASGTVALQIALACLPEKGEVITTPFTFIATLDAILGANHTPVFVDISETDFNIDVSKIEQAITPFTKAIVATHVFGNACEVEKIEYLANRYNLKVIYDAAHAFGSTYKNQPLVSFGDMSIISLHGTKVVHSVEGGMIFTNNDQLAEKAIRIRNFGIDTKGDIVEKGINGKNSELHAIVGISVFEHAEELLKKRKEIFNQYWHELTYHYSIRFPSIFYSPNNSYVPIVFDTPSQRISVQNALMEKGIVARQYFSPSLNTLPFVRQSKCPVSESISERILCLPSYHSLSSVDISAIIAIIKTTLRND